MSELNLGAALDGASPSPAAAIPATPTSAGATTATATAEISSPTGDLAGGDSAELDSIFGDLSEELPKPVVAAKPAAKPGATPPAQPASPAANMTASQPAAPTRDLTGIPEGLKSIFAALPEEDFKKHAGVYRGEYVPKTAHEDEVRAARSYDHEEGYLLNPEYRKTVTEHQANLEVLESVEAAQLANAAGKPFSVKYFNDKGEISTTKVYKATPQAGVILANNYQQQRATVSSLEAQAKTIEQDHQKKYTDKSGHYTKYGKELFATTEKLPGYAEALKLAEGHFQPYELARPEVRFAQQALAAALVYMQHNTLLLKNGEMKKATAGASPGSMAGLTAGTAPTVGQAEKDLDEVFTL